VDEDAMSSLSESEVHFYSDDEEDLYDRTKMAKPHSKKSRDEKDDQLALSYDYLLNRQAFLEGRYEEVQRSSKVIVTVQQEETTKGGHVMLDEFDDYVKQLNSDHANEAERKALIELNDILKVDSF